MHYLYYMFTCANGLNITSFCLLFPIHFYGCILPNISFITNIASSYYLIFSLNFMFQEFYIFNILSRKNNTLSLSRLYYLPFRLSTIPTFTHHPILAFFINITSLPHISLISFFLCIRIFP